MTEPRLKLVVFDCDGTLVDSQHMIVTSMQFAFEREGLTFPGREATLAIVGLSLRETFLELAPQQDEATRERLTEGYKNAFFHLRMDPDHHEPLYDGARATLDWLIARDDVLLGIATGKSQRGVRALLEREGLTGSFVTVQTADDAPSKPHPGMLFQAMAEASVGADDTVVVGDTSFDMAMGRAARVHAVGVGWGYHPVAALQQAGAHHILNHYNELPGYLESHWARP